MANVVAGELLLFPENKKVEVFETPADLVYNKFNALFAHLFSKLANSHSMSLFHVSPGKGSTVPKIVNDTFPAIRATNDQPTPMITSKTVGYIHALVIDTLTFHSTDATFAQAITNSEVICGELDALTPASDRHEPVFPVATFLQYNSDRSTLFPALPVTASHGQAGPGFKTIFPTHRDLPKLKGKMQERAAGFCPLRAPVP